MKKFVYVLVAAVSAAFIMTGCGSSSSDKVDTSANENVEESSTQGKDENDGADIDVKDEIPDSEYASGVHHVEIDVKDYGTISVELDGDTAPITVDNFMTLAKDGFYDGLTFHRIRDGFMIQGGDPDGNGTGGSDKNIKGEFSSNGVENDISHTRGTISMARSSDPDSASSQFFIMQSDGTYLDGDYAGFGHVTEGMDIVDKICKDVQVEDANGTVLPDNQPVITSVKVID